MSEPTVISGSSSWPSGARRPVVTIGNFDGVHLGHRALLDRTRALAQELGGIPTAFTFDPAPRDVLRPDNTIVRIQTVKDRVQSLLDHGMERVIVEPFDADYASHDAAWFATEVLERRLGALAVVVGWDFRFGRGRGGSVDTLRECLAIDVEQVGQRQLDGQPISSSRIRQLLEGGDVATAAGLLDRPHRVTGLVVHGDARGRTLNFPTANVRPSTPLVPKSGVYLVSLQVPGGEPLPGVANIGNRPTFGGGPRQVEVHLLDWDGDLYDQVVSVSFHERLRDERAFPSKDALVAQITADVCTARALLAR